MADLAKAMVENFPQFLFFLFVVGGAAVVLREFRSIRRELSDEISTRVRAEMGALVGEATNRAEELRKVYQQATRSAEDLSRQREEFAREAGQAQAEIAATLSSARSQASELLDLIPSAEEMTWVSPRELVLKAKDAQSWKDANPYLANIDDSNATSKDLELAGDICRSHRFFEKAIDFYQRAQSKDPENFTARAELLALIAETRAKEREACLLELRALAAKRVEDFNVSGRYFNALIELDRNEDLASFALEQLESRRLSKKAAAMLRRNLAVAYSRVGRIKEALAEYKAVLDTTPQDENTMKAYAPLLLREGQVDEAEAQAMHLVELDPLDASYFHLLGQIKLAQGDLAAARSWLELALGLAAPAHRFGIEIELRKLDVRERLLSIARV